MRKLLLISFLIAVALSLSTSLASAYSNGLGDRWHTVTYEENGDIFLEAVFYPYSQACNVTFYVDCWDSGYTALQQRVAIRFSNYSGGEIEVWENSPVGGFIYVLGAWTAETWYQIEIGSHSEAFYFAIYDYNGHSLLYTDEDCWNESLNGQGFDNVDHRYFQSGIEIDFGNCAFEHLYTTSTPASNMWIFGRILLPWTDWHTREDFEDVSFGDYYFYNLGPYSVKHAVDDNGHDVAIFYTGSAPANPDALDVVGFDDLLVGLWNVVSVTFQAIVRSLPAPIGTIIGGGAALVGSFWGVVYPLINGIVPLLPVGVVVVLLSTGMASCALIGEWNIRAAAEPWVQLWNVVVAMASFVWNVLGTIVGWLIPG